MPTIDSKYKISITKKKFLKKVQDMKNNTKYSGGYSALSDIIKWFWEIIEEFDDKLRASFLVFVSG
jgi:hypothetical protein